MAKWRPDKVGSAAHIHQSLADASGANAFHDPDAELTMSATMRSYVAGLLKYAPDITFFLAPYINSYKRFLPGTFAPTKIAWSVDNRTASYRLVGDGTKGVRIECRTPGSDMNPYLACAGQLAAGLAGIEEGLSFRPRSRAMSTAWTTSRPCPIRCARRPRRCAAPRCCAPRSAISSSTITSAPRRSSRKRLTRPSPTTRWRAVSRGPEHGERRPDLPDRRLRLSHPRRHAPRRRAGRRRRDAPRAAAWAARPLEERIALVLEANRIVGQTTDRMAVELAHQMGRPVRYGGEFGGFEERALHGRDRRRGLAPDVIEDSPAFRRLIKRAPWGVVLVVAPWNYPYMTAINTIAPALIAGNAVILKHASQTLLVGERLAEAFHAAGVPEDVIQNVVRP
jgi:hypothetical protein